MSSPWSECQDAEERHRRRMLSGFYHTSRVYKILHNSGATQFVTEKNINKLECMSRLSAEFTKVQMSVDVLCFSIHNLERDVLQLLSRGIAVRIVFSIRFRNKLQSFANKVMYKGGAVRWAPVDTQLFLNMVLMDADPELKHLLSLKVRPRALVAMHSKERTKILEDVRTALAFSFVQAHAYYREFEDIWKKLEGGNSSTSG